METTTSVTAIQAASRGRAARKQSLPKIGSRQAYYKWQHDVDDAARRRAALRHDLAAVDERFAAGNSASRGSRLMEALLARFHPNLTPRTNDDSAESFEIR